MALQLRFDHLGLVVSRLDRGRKHLSGGMGIANWTDEVVDPANGVRLQFGRDAAGVCYELLEPLDETSPVHGALKTGKAILNHVAYRIPNLDEWQQRMRQYGWAKTSDPKPAIAYDGRRIQFFVSPVKHLIEVIEAWDHEHIFTSPG
jgi:methylmalonyl-CoA/ethylmalonyl-CoA epimerase